MPVTNDGPDVRLAMIQMPVEPGDPEGNMRRARGYLEAAKDAGATIALLPEALDCGWTHPSARARAGTIPGGAFCEELRRAAQETGLFVCAGIVERSGERLFNAAVLIGPDGHLLLHHRKIHELDFARALYHQGDRLGVAETALGRIGLMICADGFVPDRVIGRALGAMGARMILSPCAWAVPPDHDNDAKPYGQLWLDSYQPVAREFQLWIAGCSNVGPVTAGAWAGWRCIGCSLVVSPDGEAVVRGRYGIDAEELILVEIPSGLAQRAAPAILPRRSQVCRSN